MKNKSIEKLFNLVYTDSMTGMKNRAAFDELRKELNKYGNSLEKICAISVIFEDYDMVSRVFGNATCDDAIRGNCLLPYRSIRRKGRYLPHSKE